MQISVITATYNSHNYLPSLIRSLQAQTSKDFESIVADGGSTDGTLDILKSVNDLNIVVSSETDFGIYDALNRAIKMCSGEFYVVIGADDVFEPDAIENFQNQIDDDHTVFTCPIIINNKVSQPSSLPIFLSGSKSRICGHSMATLFKKNLHEKYGYYSKKYPIAADYDFMMKLIINNENIKLCNRIAGKYGTNGISAIDHIGSASEVMRVMISNGYSISIQVAIFIARLIYSAFKTKNNI